MIKVSMHVCLYIAVYSFCFATLYAATVMSTGSFGSFVCSSGCQVVSILHLLGSLTQLTADSIPPLTTPPTEDTIFGFEVSAGPPLGATATSTAPVTSTWELTLEGWQGYIWTAWCAVQRLFPIPSIACSTQAPAQCFAPYSKALTSPSCPQYCKLWYWKAIVSEPDHWQIKMEGLEN